MVVRMKDPAARSRASTAGSAPARSCSCRRCRSASYYENQAGPWPWSCAALASLVAVVMGIGAVFGAMNTMYAIVAARTREIGTLRALGFSRRAILAAFVIESVTLALLGGLLGCLLALPMNGYSTGTGQPRASARSPLPSASRPQIAAAGVAFALVMGVVGGLLPALRAARLPITSALRES